MKKEIIAIFTVFFSLATVFCSAGEWDIYCKLRNSLMQEKAPNRKIELLNEIKNIIPEEIKYKDDSWLEKTKEIVDLVITIYFRDKDENFRLSAIDFIRNITVSLIKTYEKGYFRYTSYYDGGEQEEYADNFFRQPISQALNFFIDELRRDNAPKVKIKLLETFSNIRLDQKKSAFLKDIQKSAVIVVCKVIKEDLNSEVRLQAAKSLEIFQDKYSKDILVWVFENDADEKVRLQAIKALKNIKLDEKDAKRMAEKIPGAAATKEVRIAIIEFLTQGPRTKTVVDKLGVTSMDEKDDMEVRMAAVKALGTIATEDAFQILFGCLNAKEQNIRLITVQSMEDYLKRGLPEGNLDDRWVSQKIIKKIIENLVNTVLSEEDAMLKKEAIRLLGEYDEKKISESILIHALSDKDTVVRTASSVALENIGGEKTLAALTELLSNEKDIGSKLNALTAVRGSVVRMAREKGRREKEKGVPLLKWVLLNDESAEVRKGAIRELSKLREADLPDTYKIHYMLCEEICQYLFFIWRADPDKNISEVAESALNSCTGDRLYRSCPYQGKMKNLKRRERKGKTGLE